MSRSGVTRKLRAGAKPRSNTQTQSMFVSLGVENVTEGTETVNGVRLDVIELCCTHLQSTAIEVEGLFRLPGSVPALEALRSAFATNAADLAVVNLTEYTGEDIADFLKQYLLEAESPFVDLGVLQCFVNKSTALGRLLEVLVEKCNPQCLGALRRVLLLLSAVASHASENKMDASSLSISLAKCFFHSTLDVDAELSFHVLETLISRAHVVAKTLPYVDSCYRPYGVPVPLSIQDWQILLTNADTRSYRPGEVVLEEGSDNFSLFIIRSGEFHVVRNSGVVATLRAPALFGEMSFLGRSITSASVKAVTEGHIYVTKVAFLSKLLSSDPSLSLKFYFFLASKLARILFCENHTAADSSSLSNIGTTAREQKVDFVEVVLETARGLNMTQTFSYETGETLEQLRARVALRLDPAIVAKECRFRAYEARGVGAPLSVQKEGMAPVALFAQDGEGPGLYFGKSNPIEQSKKEKFTVAKAVILKDGRCKCSGRSGRYFICQGTLAHYAKIFGLEKGKLIEMSDITNIKRLEEDVHVVHKGKGVVFEFKEEAEAIAFHATLGAVLASLKDEQNARDIGRSLQEQSGSGQFRAVAIMPYQSESPSDLTLEKNDVIVVVEELTKDWWLGQANGRVGKFPSECVSPVHGPDENTVQAPGCLFVDQLPTPEDWELLLSESQKKRVPSNTVILQQHQPNYAIYQILSGTCAVTLDSLDENGKKKTAVLGTMGVDETFGEVSFVLGCDASASVVAQSDVELMVIEPSYLLRLFSRRAQSGLPSRFMKYLAVVLESRVRASTMKERIRQTKQEGSNPNFLMEVMKKRSTPQATRGKRVASPLGGRNRVKLSATQPIPSYRSEIPSTPPREHPSPSAAASTTPASASKTSPNASPSSSSPAASPSPDGKAGGKKAANSRLVRTTFKPQDSDYGLEVHEGDEVFVITEADGQALVHRFQGPMGYVPIDILSRWSGQ